MPGVGAQGASAADVYNVGGKNECVGVSEYLTWHSATRTWGF